MSSTIYGIICFIISISFIAFLAARHIIDLRNGIKRVDGEIIGIDHENKTLRIRYRSDKDTYHEFDYHHLQCFATGVYPKIGLKVGVAMRKDSPFPPVSVLLQRDYTPGGRHGYVNSSRLHTILRIGLLSGFFIFCGILLLTGQIS